VDAEEDCLISHTANAVAIQVYKDDFQIEKKFKCGYQMVHYSGVIKYREFEFQLTTTLTIG